MTRMQRSCVATALLALATTGHAQTPSNDELYRIIQQQQEQIEELKRELRRADGETGDEAKRERLEAKIEAQQKQIDALAERADRPSLAERVDIGGYGELHYNNFDRNEKDDKIDFHRFVLYFGHEFTDNIRFFSELELEHALSGDGEPGEVELEQAFIEFDLGQRHAARAGLDLIPIGIINPTHEPNTFYGVERNRVESAIIPSTWWAGGAKLIGRPTAQGLSYELFVHEGMQMDADPGFSIRGGRQKTAEATANEFATTGTLKYTGVPGLELAASAQYQSDVTQQRNDGLEEAMLYEAHAVYSRGPFGLRALYAQWDLDGSIAEDNDRDKQFGWYVEPSVKLHPQLGVFARYSELEETEDLTEENTTVGFNYWPIKQVVLKADYQWREFESGDPDDDSFNLGVGYVFP